MPPSSRTTSHARAWHSPCVTLSRRDRHRVAGQYDLRETKRVGLPTDNCPRLRIPYSLRMLWRDRRRYLPALRMVPRCRDDKRIARNCCGPLDPDHAGGYCLAPVLWGGGMLRGTCPSEKGFTVVSNESGKDVTEQYRTRYRRGRGAQKRCRGVLRASGDGGPLVVIRHLVALPGHDRGVLLRSCVVRRP